MTKSLTVCCFTGHFNKTSKWILIKPHYSEGVLLIHLMLNTHVNQL